MELSGLERLLCLSSVLLLESRDDNGSASNSNSITLKQLFIAVHESLLNSVVQLRLQLQLQTRLLLPTHTETAEIVERGR